MRRKEILQFAYFLMRRQPPQGAPSFQQSFLLPKKDGCKWKTHVILMKNRSLWLLLSLCSCSSLCLSRILSSLSSTLLSLSRSCSVYFRPYQFQSLFEDIWDHLEKSESNPSPSPSKLLTYSSLISIHR